MNRMVKCPGCAAEYNIDLTKYGGKKIKCKNCQAVIAIPAEGQDEFEVVEESLPVSEPQWYYAQNKQKVGPIPWTHLQAMAASGQIQPTEHAFAGRWE